MTSITRLGMLVILVGAISLSLMTVATNGAMFVWFFCLGLMGLFIGTLVVYVDRKGH